MPDGTRGVAVAVTDAVGAFHVEQLDRGAWRLLITSECHPDTVESGVTEQVGQVIAGLEFVLEDALEIGGRVEGVLAAAADGLWVRAMAVPTGELPPGTSRRAADELAAVPRRVRCAPDGSFVVRGLRQHTTYRLAAADSGVWFGPTRSPWVEARVGAVDVVLACRPRAAVVFQVLDGQTSAPLTDLEVRAGYRCMLPVTGRDGQVQRHFPAGRVRIDDLFAQSAQESIEVIVTSPGYAENRVADVRPIGGQDLDLGILRLWR